jgi:toxin ParE1/3/4
MRLRWTAPSVQDLYNITRYIRRDNPTAAREVAKTIYDGCESLIESPRRGRKGKQPGTRELVFSPLPYIAVYRVTPDTVEILHIWHAAQNWR